MADVARRFAAFVAVTAVATIAALGAFIAAISLRIGGDGFFVASLDHAALILPVALWCGVVVAAAGTIHGAPVVDVRRAEASAALLLAIGVTAVLVWSALPARDFDGAKFRAAAAAGDRVALAGQAYRAVDHEALIAMTASQVRTTLGKPDRVDRERNAWVWELGTVSDLLGARYDAAFYVEFDAARSRVLHATVESRP